MLILGQLYIWMQSVCFIYMWNNSTFYIICVSSETLTVGVLNKKHKHYICCEVMTLNVTVSRQWESKDYNLRPHLPQAQRHFPPSYFFISRSVCSDILFWGMLDRINFTSDKYFGLVDIYQNVMERNPTVCRRGRITDHHHPHPSVGYLSVVSEESKLWG